MVLNFLLDTNIALYHLSDRLLEPLPKGTYLVSFITELELLAFPALTDEEKNKVSLFLNDLEIIDINPSIKALTIELRRQFRLKLPDAIIVSTAKYAGATLLTADKQLISANFVTAKSLKLRKKT